MIASLSQLSLSGTTVPAFPSQVVASAYDTSGNGGRRIVRLSNGWIVSTAWQSTGTQHNFYVSKDNGQTFSLLAYAGINASQIAIASSGTTVYALIAPNGGGSNNWIYKFDATTVSSSSSLSSGAAVESQAQSSFGSGVSLTIDSTGVLYATWCSKNSTYPNAFNIRMSSSTDGGTTWATPTQVTVYNSGTNPFQNPCIVVDSSNKPKIFCAAQLTLISPNGDSNGDWSIVCLKQGTNNNGTLLASGWMFSNVYAPSNSYTQSSPCATVDNNDAIHVVWHGDDGTSFKIMYAKSTDSGVTWSSKLNLTADTTNQMYASISCDSSTDNLYVFFHGYDSAISTNYLNIRKIVNTNGSWSSVTTLTNSTSAHIEYPQTLWSKFNMNSSDTVQYIYQDSQAGQVSYNQYTQIQKPAPPPIVEEKILLWSADGTTGVSTINNSAGATFIDDGGGTSSSSASRLFTLSTTFPSSQKFALEATIWSSGNLTDFALWDFTTGTIVSSSQITTSSSSPTTVRSGQITLSLGHQYGLTLWTPSTSNTAYMCDASLIVFP